MLDTSSEGAPLFPTHPTFNANLGGAAPGPGAVLPNEDLIVEVEFAPGIANLASALTANLGGFLAGATGALPPGSSMASVLRDLGVSEAKPVFSRERVLEDEQQTNALRERAAMGAATQDEVSVRERLPSLSQFVRFRFPSGTSAKDVTTALKRFPEVVRAVAVPRAAPPSLPVPIPSDPLIGAGSGPLVPDPVTHLESQWYLHRTRVPQAWRYARGANVVVADIDWGYRTTHQDLKPAIEKTYNAVDGSNNVTQGLHSAHGTAVIGLAGARANGLGMAGYAPESVLWAIQGDSAPGPVSFTEPWAEAIDFVRRTDSQSRRKVIILEVQTGEPVLGNYEQVPSVHRAIRAAIADGCVVCVAAGNGDRPADRTDDDQPFDPTGSILVGATAYDDKINKRAWFSNYGSRIVVSAPGDATHDLTCAQNGDNAYRNGFGGTSGATPKVAGVAALMLSVNPALTHHDVRDILAGMGSPLTEDPGKPIGVFLNAEASVAEALRRRSEEPSLEASKAPHGVNRRKAQMVLPRDTGGPLTWDDEEEEAPAVLAMTEAAAPVPGETPPGTGDKPLRVFRDTVEGTLTQEDRILIVEQAIQMLDNFYVHRPLKEAMHAVRPIQRLRVLLRRLQPSTRDRAGEEQVSSELAFHNTITQIFNSVRDLHTSYQLPRPFRECIAYLPFEVASFHEEGRRRYLVTRVVSGYAFAHPEFQPGVELLYWNGMAIARAVRANAEQTAGSNEAARHARGVSALTIRPMNTALPPEADFVDLEFVPLAAAANDAHARRQMRQSWFVRFAPQLAGGVEAPAAAPSAAVPPQPPAAQPPLTFETNALDLERESVARSAAVIFDDMPPAAAPAAPPAAPAAAAANTQMAGKLALASVLGLDTAADAVREARQLIFEPGALRDLQRASAGDELYGIRGSASPVSASDSTTGTEIGVKVEWTAAFRARTVMIDGLEYGHIHIRTFYFNDANGFVAEFVRLLNLMPKRGLILDVRGNGGGNILAAEQLIQTLTPVEVEPERMQFIVSGGTRDLCRNNAATSRNALNSWLPSIEEGVETGSVYSHAFAVTDRQDANSIGQRYYGPVVLIVDGNCYSATDMFAAGFQDHSVGDVLGVSNATGAGGANVWEHKFLTEALPAGWGLEPLPSQAAMRVALRQCLRVGGALLEDFGVVPNLVHPPTRADVMEGDRDLLAEAAKILKAKPVRSIKVTQGNLNGGNRQLQIETENVRRLDFFINDRPEGSRNLSVDANGAAKLGVGITQGATVRLIAYANPDDKRPAAAYRGAIS